MTPDGHRPGLKGRGWLWLYTVMVHPEHQGQGYGRAPMPAAGAARTFEGVEAVRLTCRGGPGRERFYGSCGCQEAGRVPGPIRVAPGRHRDHVLMLLPLRTPEQDRPPNVLDWTTTPSGIGRVD